MAWCGHCVSETADEQKLVRESHGRIRVVQLVVQDEYGSAPTHALLERWVRDRRSALPTGIEQSGVLAKRFSRAATFLLVDLRDHRRVLFVGEGPRGFEAATAQAQAG
jgi:hypothetical protein